MLLSDTEVAAVMSVSRNTVWRWASSLPNFPQPVRIGGATRWRKADVDRYIADLEADDHQVDVEEYIGRAVE